MFLQMLSNLKCFPPKEKRKIFEFISQRNPDYEVGIIIFCQSVYKFPNVVVRTTCEDLSFDTFRSISHTYRTLYVAHLGVPINS